MALKKTIITHETDESERWAALRHMIMSAYIQKRIHEPAGDAGFFYLSVCKRAF
jgi:predicted RNA-binding protein with PUA-like domain